MIVRSGILKVQTAGIQSVHCCDGPVRSPWDIVESVLGSKSCELVDVIKFEPRAFHRFSRG